MANHIRSKAASFHEQAGHLRLLNSLVIQKIRFKKGFSFPRFFSLEQLLGFKPMLQSSSLWASVRKVKVIREGFDHLMLA